MNCSADERLKRIQISDGALTRDVEQVRLSPMEVRTPSLWLIVASTSFYRCATCGFHACFTCQKPAHVTLTCRQANAERIKREHSGEEGASTRWLGTNTKQCFSCQRNCEKISGCDHITCRCGAEWCWLCRAPYTDIRKVGNQAHRKSCRYHA